MIIKPKLHFIFQNDSIFAVRNLFAGIVAPFFFADLDKLLNSDLCSCTMYDLWIDDSETETTNSKVHFRC
jgi:hypothetical protein